MINTKSSQSAFKRRSLTDFHLNVTGKGINFNSIIVISLLVGLFVLFYLSMLNSELAYTLITGIILILSGFVLSNIFFLRSGTHLNHLHHQMIVEYSTDMYLIYRIRDGKFIFVSPALTNLMGYDPSVVVDKYDLSFIHPRDSRGFHNILTPGFLRLNRQFTEHFRMLHRTGKLIWVELTGNVIVSPSNELEYVVMNFRDITHRKEVELTNLQYSKSLEQLIEKYNDNSRSEVDQHNLINLNLPGSFLVND